MQLASAADALAHGRPIEEVLPLELLLRLRSDFLGPRPMTATTEQTLQGLADMCGAGRGRAHLERILLDYRAAVALGERYALASNRGPDGTLQQLLTYGAQHLELAKELVRAHSVAQAVVARILAESFLKGLTSSRGTTVGGSDEGARDSPWSAKHFLECAPLCSEPAEIGNALLALVLEQRDVPSKCEVELLLLALRYYDKAASLEGVDAVLELCVARSEAYAAAGDFRPIVRLATCAAWRYRALRPVFQLVVRNDQVEMLLMKRRAERAGLDVGGDTRQLRVAVLAALERYRPGHSDTAALVHHRFNMGRCVADALVETGEAALASAEGNAPRLLGAMLCFVEAAEEYMASECARQAAVCCARAALVALKVRRPSAVPSVDLAPSEVGAALARCATFGDALAVYNVACEPHGADADGDLGVWAEALWQRVVAPWGGAEAAAAQAYLEQFCATFPLQNALLTELAQRLSDRGEDGGCAGGLEAVLESQPDLRVRLAVAQVAGAPLEHVAASCRAALDLAPGPGAWLAARVRP